MKPNRILAIVVGVIVVLAIVAGVVASTRPAPEFDPSTPEGTVQLYLQTLFDDDEEGAAGYLAPENACDADDLAQADEGESVRVLLGDVNIDADTARVEVEIIVTSADGPFGGYEYSVDESFTLRREGEGWLITGEPWPAYFCEGRAP